MKQQDIEAKTRQIVDTLFEKERVKIKAKLDNIEQSQNREIKHISIQIAKATTDRKKQMWMQKLAEISDIEVYKNYLLDQLESYN